MYVWMMLSLRSCSITARCTSLLRKYSALVWSRSIVKRLRAEIEFRPARQIILVLGLLRAVFEVAIVDRFRTAHVVDANDHGVHIGERALALEGERGQRETDSGEYKDRHLQVGVHHQRIAILFEIAFRSSRNLRRCLLSVCSSLPPQAAAIIAARIAIIAPARPPPPPPAWPLKRACVIAGILNRM